jgi:hypothetical protein
MKVSTKTKAELMKEIDELRAQLRIYSFDITERKKAELNAKFLSDLNDMMRHIQEPQEILPEVATAVVNYSIGIRALSIGLTTKKLFH